MGADEEQKLSGKGGVLTGKEGKEIEAIKVEAQELKEFYKKLRQENDSHSRSIVGLTTEKEDVRKRIRVLLNKRQKAEGPDFDEYQVNRRVSRQYEPIDPSRRKVSLATKSSVTISSTSDEIEQEDNAVEFKKPSLPASVTITVKAN